MYAVMEMSGNIYATKFNHGFDDEAQEYIESFISQGTPVTLVEELHDAATLLGVEEEEIQIVERED